MHDVKAKPGSKRVWGDGLVDQLLGSSYAHTTWDDVSSDELIVLMPALARQDSRVGKTRNAAFFIRRMLTARVFDCIARIAGETAEPVAGSATRQAAIDILVRSQVVGAISPIDAALGGDDLWKEHFGRQLAPRSRGQRAAALPPAGQADHWALEFTILAAVDRLLRDAERTSEDGSAPAAVAIQPFDALLAATYASLNAAYVYPELEHMHETLMLGAWLGFLERGRPVLMPDFIAERIVLSLKTKGEIDITTDEGRCEGFIRAHLIFAAEPHASLLRLAERVRRSGRPCLVKPAPRVPSPELLRTVINEALKRRLEMSGVLPSEPSPIATS